MSDAIHALGQKRHAVQTHWHKRVVRSGPNTLEPFKANPPDRTIDEDDILVVDLGPVFESWEADFGRTYIMGNAKEKETLRDKLEPLWYKVKGMFDADPDMTGEQLYFAAKQAAAEEGYDWGADIAGHLVGDFPHERVPQDRLGEYITEGNKEKMRTKSKKGFDRHWILEIHLRDKQGRWGGFYELLLTC